MNKRTRLLIDAYVGRPVGSLVVEGSENSGAVDVVREVAKKLLKSYYPSQFHEITSEDKPSIGIDEIREIKSLLSTKANADQAVTRVLAVYDASRMTPEAQNALLKIIEEPTPRSVLVLQANNKSELLPTITSRCQTIPVLPLSRKQAMNIADEQGITPIDAIKAFKASVGLSGEYKRVLNGAPSEQLVQGKEFLQKSTFERLQMAKKFDKKPELATLISSLQRIAEAGLRAPNVTQSQKWQKIARELNEIIDILKSNGSVKLAYLRLSVMV